MGRFNLKINLSQQEGHWRKRKASAQCVVTRQNQESKQKQINDALKYCAENGCRGWQALNTGRFPLVKDPKTINRRLDGAVKNEKEKEYCSILTVCEERQIVDHLKNRNRALQGLGRAELTKLIVHTLKVRQYGLKRMHGRKFIPLSTYAKNALHKGSLSQSFWKRWDAKHTSLTRKRQGNVNMNRAMNCTRDMAINHLNELAEELITQGIFTNAKKIDEGKWEGDVDLSRIINHDETPQFINYGVDGSANGLIYAAKGDACNKMLKENRECVTIEPFVTLSGEILMCHVIFKGSGITSHMATEHALQKIDNLFISTSESGVQDHKSLLETYKFLDKILLKKKVQKPVEILSDGHSSRFDFDNMTFLNQNLLKLFIGPPDTTGVTQLLDQINHSLHDSYRKEKDKEYLHHHSINRSGFIDILANTWNAWAPKDTIVQAAKRVGISSSGLNVDWMQQDKFRVAELLINNNDTDPKIPEVVVSSPEGIRKGSRDYYRFKYESAIEKLKTLADTSVDLEEAGVLTTSKITPKDTSKQVRLTQVCGSMEGKDILNLLSTAKKEKEYQAQKKKDRVDKRERERQLFLICKDSCVCKNKKCSASGFKQCPRCKDVLRSICSKAACRDEDGAKPTMIVPKCDETTTLHVRRRLLLDDFPDDDPSSFSKDEPVALDEDVTDDDVYCRQTHDEPFKKGDCVKIIGGAFEGYYALILDKSYDDKYEINYFEKRFGKYVPKDFDLDSRSPSDLMPVIFEVDSRSRYMFF